MWGKLASQRSRLVAAPSPLSLTAVRLRQLAPWERQGADLKPDSSRNRVLTLLQYASQNKILGRLNRAKPDSMEAILNEFLRKHKIDDLLLSETKITSHR